MSSLHDLQYRNDIIRLVNRFYECIRSDAKLGTIFNDIAQVNTERHLPRMYDIWDTVLFRSGTFRGNPLIAHAKLVRALAWAKPALITG